VEIHPGTEVTGIVVEGGRVRAAETSRGRVEAPTIVAATAGWSSEVCRMAGVDLPIVTHPLQAFVTEPLKPFLHVIVVSATLHVYVSQTDRGEVLIGSEIEPYASYSQRSTLDFLEVTARHALELFPCLREVRVLRAWAGLCDVTPDYSPIMGPTPVEGFYVDVGWGTYGFKAAPIAGATMAELVETGRVPPLIRPFGLSRFEEGRPVSEIAAAAVSH
jgi:sarcosine oxidase subunit beta